MFTQPAPAPTTTGLGSAAASAVSPTSPTSRTSRLRGLTYLRNYTQTHLLSREHSNTSNASTASHQSNSSSASASNHAAKPAGGLSRTTSCSSAPPPAAAATVALGSAPRQDVNPTPSLAACSPLVPALQHPLGSTHGPSPISSAPASSQPPAGAPAAGPIVPGRGSTESSMVPPHGLNHPMVNAAPNAAASLAPADVTAPSMTRGRSATASEALVQSNMPGSNLDILPSIRLSAYYDPRATRPSLTFSPISRTLPTGAEVIRVGRYSERDSQPNVPANLPSAAPVGFKSKVVSRRHCEFWYEGGKWYIKDVKSSSGTFLNHIRLSPPGTESKPYAVNDGDIVQLGIDFKGGEEMIFRCVKMRLELNRGWQNKLNTFNMTTHKRLRNMTANPAASAAGQSYSQDCSICLNSIAPCQCLFVAPCSHTWHYKCIRSLLSSPQYPIFICPNCRAAADLEAEVEDPEEWEQLESDDPQDQDGAPLQPSGSGDVSARSQSATAPPRRSRESERRMPPPTSQPPPPPPVPQDSDAMDVTMHLDQDGDTHMLGLGDGSSSGHANGTGTPTRTVSHATSIPVPIPMSLTSAGRRMAAGSNTSTPNNDNRQTRTPSPNGNGVVLNGHEGPITPRNDAGPWVFDGSGVRMRTSGGAGVSSSTGTARGQIASLDAALPVDGEGRQIASLDAILPDEEQ